VRLAPTRGQVIVAREVDTSIVDAAPERAYRNVTIAYQIITER
jgi:hypothetical protein